MGMLIEGRWTDTDQIIINGAYKRQASIHNQDIAPDTIKSIGEAPERFHLIASLSCPWSHRAMIVRQLKQLQNFIPIHIAGGQRIQGYPINDGKPWIVPGSRRSIVHLHQLYTLSNPMHTGRPTVPVLWDSHTQTIISDESAKIIRAFDAVQLIDHDFDFTLLPKNLITEIDGFNTRIYQNLSNAVYKAGFAESQTAYDEAVQHVFETLNQLEEHLAQHRYLLGSIITEADWRLFPTLVRFDIVYFKHHNCSQHRLIDYANLWAYARDLYAWQGVAKTINFDIIHSSSYENDVKNSNTHIIPVIPETDWLAPHGRDILGPAQLTLRSGEIVNIDPATLNIIHA